MLGDFVDYLLADSGLSALVGTRVWTGRLPEGGAKPALCCHLISDVPETTHDSRGEELSMARVQVDVYGETAGDALAAMRALKARAHGARATQGDTVFAMQWENAVERWDEELRLHGYACDVMVWYRAGA